MEGIIIIQPERQLLTKLPRYIFAFSMPRVKLHVWQHYKKTVDEKKRETVICNFCSQKYVFPNATRMTKHLRQCKKCPQNILESLNSEAETIQGNTKSNL